MKTKKTEQIIEEEDLEPVIDYVYQLAVCKPEDLYYNFMRAMYKKRFVNRERIDVFSQLKSKPYELQRAVMNLHRDIVVNPI